MDLLHVAGMVSIRWMQGAVIWSENFIIDACWRSQVAFGGVLTVHRNGFPAHPGRRHANSLIDDRLGT